MITTAAGLIVATPLVIIESWLSVVIDDRVADMEKYAIELIALAAGEDEGDQ